VNAKQNLPHASDYGFLGLAICAAPLTAGAAGLSSASISSFPSVRAMVTPHKNASVGAMSAGLAAVRYSPALIPSPIKITGTRES
jgi:hypothetical protein